MDPDFDGLQVMARRLYELTDSINCQLNHRIEEIEKQLPAIVEAFLLEPIGQDEEEIYRLGYGSAGMAEGRCCLLIKSIEVRNPDRERVDGAFPLLNASLALRMAALKQVPDLVEALKVEVARRIHDIEISAKEMSYVVSIDQGAYPRATNRTAVSADEAQGDM